ncbi:polymer-forming cytoskeletal protein [Haloplasma contractile]|uniref:Polymer-forming cytoskeletal protein n=1 Tax=Haloplasma contractile SSD-17B TaxID=1033810 RepID=U2DXH7_9MOLU|nr:polymer-forming cytoskeletal protein [Haloplasma contractile]ERJ12992.1 Polymer-forming cytoskeletal protein [Haloplasma contractile SSD-17B]
MNNLNVFAGATITGGEYDKIRVFGAAEINGDLKANKMTVYGATEINGKCEVDEMNIMGACDFKDLVKVRQLSIKGASEFMADVHVDYFKIYGAAEFKASAYRSKEIIIYGAVNTTRLESDRIVVKGAIECTEQLNADRIEIVTENECKINELVGSELIIRKPKKILGILKKHGKEEITVNNIEGDTIELENVTANTVQGKTIKIGPNCKINHIIYQESCDVSEKSTVGEIEQM